MIINSQLVPDLLMLSTKQENSGESLEDEDLLQQHCKKIKLESFQQQADEDCNNNLNNTSNRNISQKESKKMFKSEFKFQQIDQLNTKCCTGCQLSIEDKYVFNLMNTYWHEDCLQCSQCRIQLQKTCFFKNGLLYCKDDYLKQFGTRCNACYELIISNELVMRFLINATTANEQLLSYHLNCFKCLTCERHLQKGDEFVLKNEGIYCKHDFEQQSHAAQHSTLINRLNSKPLYHSFDHNEELTQKTPKQTQRKSTASRRITKRPRTILNAVQRYDFREAFKQSPKPCRKVREHLASKTGLSVRVVQVWFQNERAKVKKMQRRQQQHLINQKLNGKKGIKSIKKTKKGRNRSKFDSDLNSEENSLAANDDEDEYDELNDEESEQSSDDDLYDESDEDLEEDDEDDDIGLKEMSNPVQSPGNLNTNNTSSSSSSSTSSSSNNSDFILHQQQQHNYQQQQQHHMYQQHSHQMHHFAHQQQPIDRLFSMQNAYFD